jgi:uncharacterized protein YutE (UPF0331/DUF86 family)
MRKSAINRKLVAMGQYLSELEILSHHSLKEYLADFKIKRACERLIQVIVESAVDCNNLILVGLGDSPPVDYKESFTKLVTHSIIPPNFASQLISYVSIRNRIVHEYDEVKDNLIYAAINMLLRDMKRYQQLIVNYLKTV